jgi:hypothetical protein
MLRVSSPFRGVVRCANKCPVLKDELETTMWMMGVTDLSQVSDRTQ